MSSIVRGERSRKDKRQVSQGNELKIHKANDNATTQKRKRDVDHGARDDSTTTIKVYRRG